MRAHDVEYSTFREISALVMTWNAGAATPAHLRQNGSDSRFFDNLLHSRGWPDILIFGFQELVDLEDKKLTASKRLVSLTLHLEADVIQRVYSRAIRRGIRWNRST